MVRKKVKQEVDIVDISLGNKNTVEIPFSLCQECWAVLNSVEEFRSFVKMHGIPTEISSFDNCCSVATFLIGMEVFLSEEQLRILYYWLESAMRSYFVSFGVTSRTPSVVFTNHNQRYSFFKFFSVLGHSIVKNSCFNNGKKIIYSSDCLSILKKYGIYS